MSRVRAWLDATPLAEIALALMREATGREKPLEALMPARPERLRADARVGLWSLCGGVGTSTTAALIAQRSSAAGHPPLLVDLDRWAPSLALRAGIDAATVVDALVQPDRERELVSHWAGVPFLPGSPALHRDFDVGRICALVDRLAHGRALVADLGSGADALEPQLVARLTRLCIVTGARASQLQSLFCGRALVAAVACPIGLIVVGAAQEDAALIARRADLPLLGAVPDDPYLAQDDFAVRAPTIRAIDGVIRSL